jgi:hypothetical protein
MSRVSLPVAAATLLAGCALAAGGFLLGRGSAPERAPATVPQRALTQPGGGVTVALPPSVRLPRR